jgi:hypothetical protein
MVMGYRIHKQMGWGFTAKPKAFKKIVNLKRDGHVPVSDYLTFLRNKPETRRMNDLTIPQPAEEIASYTSRDLCFIYDDSEVDMWTLIITPLAVRKDWVHYDDALDYAEEELRYSMNPDEKPLEPTTQQLAFAQFPYNSFWMNSVTGQELRSYNPSDIQFLVDMKKQGKLRDGVEEEEMAEHGLKSFKDIKKIVPNVPFAVKDISEWLNVFHEPDDWKLLRPMILTYWE